MDDLISRQAVLKIIDGWYENNRDIENIEDLIILITYMASIKPQAQEPCSDAISRAEAIRVASGYCHWSNIPDELAKLPSVTPAQNVCEDAVSRELVKKDIARWIGYIDDDMIARMHITIDKLPSVTPKPCEDAISRQAVIDALSKTSGIRGDALKALYELPSVSTEKTGRWIFVDKAKEHAHCSECDYGNVDLFDGRPHNYCPNCGARMEVEE